jgi:hypothetical protein
MNANSTRDTAESVENAVPAQRLRGDHRQRESPMQDQVDAEIFGTSANGTNDSDLTETTSYAIFFSFDSESCIECLC